MMEIVPVKTSRDLMKFIKFPFKLYKNDPYWVAPLLMEQKKFLNPHKNPYFEHSEVQLFLAYKDNKLAGRISAQTNVQHNKTHNDKVGFFGFFESINDQEVTDRLIDTAVEWLKAKGCDTIRGPMSFSVNDECALLIDPFDSSPMVMMPYNPHYYKTLLEKTGLKKIMDIYAYYIPVKKPPERLVKLAEKIEKRGKFTVRSLKTKNKKKLKNDIAMIFNIYEKAWKNNWGYVPMSAKEFDLLVDSIMPIIRPEFVFIAEADGKAVGFSVTLPDYNYILKKIKGRLFPFGWLKYIIYKNKIPGLRVPIMGVLEKYKNRGIDVVFYYRSFKTAFEHKNPYRDAEFSWVLETNKIMNRISKSLTAEIYKTYRIFDKKII
ncbi:MAG: GNAT family N-acetyltransferase [Candidatus Cloacimonetes bacterium]|nr:GNAT family N-acetyltransferase [Candidatus Cloacimonadota bacterium]